jgi:hypothetical protein
MIPKQSWYQLNERNTHTHTQTGRPGRPLLAQFSTEFLPWVTEVTLKKKKSQLKGNLFLIKYMIQARIGEWMLKLLAK